MFAVIESGGKQHTVSEGDQLKVELLSGEEGAAIEFDKVLMISDGSASKLGNPFVENAKVTAKLIGHGKAKKVKIFKMKRRKDYRRTYGHRQNFTEILIEYILSIILDPYFTEKLLEREINAIHNELAILMNERFIIRSFSPMETIGVGTEAHGHIL